MFLLVKYDDGETWHYRVGQVSMIWSIIHSGSQKHLVVALWGFLDIQILANED